MRKSIEKGLMALAVISLLVLSGCGSGGSSEKKSEGAVTKAVAVMHPTDGNKTEGVVTFTKEKKGIRVTASLKGLSPGQHGFHIHEKGDCRAPDATSAGGHFDPTHMAHGDPDAGSRHVGDLGNIEADLAGNAEYDRLDSVITFEGPTSILGKGVIIHAQQDDLKTQPTGASGARVACGVIVEVKQ
jgi:superoxide dismutase, Cu-Zn family